MRTFYEWLKIKRDATPIEIDRAYSKRIAESNSKKGSKSRQLKNIEKGYRILSDSDTRMKYDRWVMLKECRQFKSNCRFLYLIIVFLVFGLGASWIYIFTFTSSASNKRTLNDYPPYHTEEMQGEESPSGIENDPLYDFGDYDYVGYADGNVSTSYMNSGNSSSFGQKDTEEKSSNMDLGEEKYEVTVYKTGDMPFWSFFGRGEYDDDSLCELLISNFSQFDAVVLLVKDTGEVLRNVYVKSQSQYALKNIPFSMCFIKVMMGNDWNSKKNNGSNNPRGGFMRNLVYSESARNDPFDFFPIYNADMVEYPSYSITLHKVVNGNLSSKEITQDNFFKK